MFTDSVKIRYEDWEAEILPSFGANVIRLKKNGNDILRSPENGEELKKSPYLYGIPLLFPPNRTKNGEFVFGEGLYRLPINEPSRGNHLHGLLFDAPFTVIEGSSRKVKCVYENRGERYPFCFRMTIGCMLDGNGFTQEVLIENTGDGPMPVQLAFHTTFKEPEEFHLPIGKRWETDDNFIPTGKLGELNRQELEYCNGCNPRGKTISGFYTAEGNRAVVGDFIYTVSENFTQWILFNAGGDKGFLCIEPQSGPVNGLNMPEGHICLGKGERVNFSTNLSIKNRMEQRG